MCSRIFFVSFVAMNVRMKSGSSGMAGTFWGYLAGIVTGVTYGLNPLFAVPLMKSGVSVDTILFFRYFLAVVILGAWLALRKESFRITWHQARRLLILGLLFSLSSLTLFEAYHYIPSGVATTIVFLYPVLVALIMMFLKVYPTWQVWVSIIATFVGVLFLCRTDGAHTMQWRGLALSFASALSYAMFIVIINRSRSVHQISNTLLTFYALLTGVVVFSLHAFFSHAPLLAGIHGVSPWINLVGLALLPTIVSTATLAMATRIIGATRASVLGVFEPVTAILVGAIAFGESITVNVVIGIILTMAAIIFMIVSPGKSKGLS